MSTLYSFLEGVTNSFLRAISEARETAYLDDIFKIKKRNPLFYRGITDREFYHSILECRSKMRYVISVNKSLGSFRDICSVCLKPGIETHEVNLINDFVILIDGHGFHLNCLFLPHNHPIYLPSKEFSVKVDDVTEETYTRPAAVYLQCPTCGPHFMDVYFVLNTMREFINFWFDHNNWQQLTVEERRQTSAKMYHYISFMQDCISHNLDECQLYRL